MVAHAALASPVALFGTPSASFVSFRGLVRNDMFRYECEGAERAAPQPEFIAPNDLVLLCRLSD